MKIKLSVVLIFISLVMCSIGLYYAYHPITVSTISQSVEYQSPPNEIIKKFFNQYYQAYETHQSPNFSSLIDTNDHTLLFIRQLDYRLALFSMFNDYYDTMTVELTYYNTKFSPTQFTTSVYVFTSYHYNRDPNALISHNGTLIDLTLEPHDGNWMITAISPQDTEYEILQSAITNRILLSNNESYFNIINSYMNERISNLNTQRRQWDDFVATYATLSPDQSQLNIPVNLHTLLASYDGNAAATYGETFGSIFENGIFKRVDADCTNFVSQCLWAGYGGTNGVALSNTNELKSRVKHNYRMIDLSGSQNDWWGLNADSSLTYPSSAFMRVTELYNLCTNNQTLGPKAFGYNNNQYYWQLEGTTIHRGDVLQFYSYSNERYSHSVIVVSPETESYNSQSPWNIRVAQHTGDYSRRPLHQIITVFSDTTSNGQTRDCKMRLLKPVPGSFIE